jgi:hypothetical protein
VRQHATHATSRGKKDPQSAIGRPTSESHQGPAQTSRDKFEHHERQNFIRIDAQTYPSNDASRRCVGKGLQSSGRVPALSQRFQRPRKKARARTLDRWCSLEECGVSALVSLGWVGQSHGPTFGGKIGQDSAVLNFGAWMLEVDFENTHASIWERSGSQRFGIRMTRAG